MDLPWPHVVLSLMGALPSCAHSVVCQDAAHRGAPAVGEVVDELGSQIWVVFQGRDLSFWFGSDGEGLYRFDGETLVRFTTEHGLVGNHIRGIQEDRSGNIYVSTEPAGVSRFDGRTFTTLSALEPAQSEWRLAPEDLWFSCGQDTGAVYRYDGERLHHLAFPKSEAGEEHIARHPRSQFPNAKYSPYDVYTIFKDSRGHVWFGTAVLGACRYDGTSHAWIAEPGRELGSFGTRAIIEDRAGHFWFSSVKERYVVDGGDVAGRGAHALRYRVEEGLVADGLSVFNSALLDRNGHLWLTTLGSGVWRDDGRSVTHYPVLHEGASIWVYSIYSDREGTLWLGTQEHGVYRFHEGAFERVRRPSRRCTPRIRLAPVWGKGSPTRAFPGRRD